MNIYAISNTLCPRSSFKVDCITCIQRVTNKFSCGSKDKQTDNLGLKSMTKGLNKQEEVL